MTSFCTSNKPEYMHSGIIGMVRSVTHTVYKWPVTVVIIATRPYIKPPNRLAILKVTYIHGYVAVLIPV